MFQREIPDTTTLITQALDWWRDAGVDCAFVDEPVRWLAAPDVPAEREPPPETSAERPRQVAARAAPSAPPVPTIATPPDIPASLEAFTQWWMTEPSIAEGTLSARVPPRGPAGAELMVIVPEPEAQDAGRLLDGAQGRLLDAMLTAFGIAPHDAYVASALPRHLPAADWGDLAARGTGAILQRHVSLVAPRRLLVLGSNIPPLFGNDLPQGAAEIGIFNHEGMTLPMLVARSLAALLEQPRWKGRVWQAWLDWTA